MGRRCSTSKARTANAREPWMHRVQQRFASRNKLFKHLDIDHTLRQRTLRRQVEAEEETDSRVNSAREIQQEVKGDGGATGAQTACGSSPNAPVALSRTDTTAPPAPAPQAATPEIEDDDDDDPRGVDIVQRAGTREIVEEPAEWDMACTSPGRKMKTQRQPKQAPRG